MLNKGFKWFVISILFVVAFFVTTSFPTVNSYADDEGTKEVELKISGMTCAACGKKVKSALESVKGVIKVEEVSHKEGEADVYVDEGAVNNDELIEAVKKAGFTVESIEDES